MKPRTFVASSSEALSIAHAVQKNLGHQAEVTVWDQDFFQLSQTSVQVLASKSEDFDFGVFVFSSDDLVLIRGEQHQVARDNVIFELGLFIGRLGQSRCFILAPGGESNLHLPTDLLGIAPATYEVGRSDGNWQAATGPACTDIRQEIQRQGPRRSPAERTEGTIPTKPPLDSPNRLPEGTASEESPQNNVSESIEPCLSAFIDGRLPEALSELDSRIENETEADQKFRLNMFRAFLSFEQSVIEGDKEYRSLATKHPDKPDPWTMLSRRLLMSGFPEEALAVSTEGLEAFPAATELFFAKLDALDVLQRSAEVEAELLEILQTPGSDHEECFRRLFQIQSQNGKTNEALGTLERGLAKFPFSLPLLEGKANLLFLAYDFSRSIVTYKQLISLKPEEPRYHALLGNSLLEFRLYGLAFDAYRKADTLANSDQGWIRANIGNVLNRRGFVLARRSSGPGWLSFV